MDIRLPNLGEGADSGSVVTIAVKIGDRIVKDQIVIELENEKAVAAIPSPTEGVVEKIYVKIGDKVAVGQPVLSVVSAVSSVAGSVAPKAPPAPVRPVQTDDAAEKMPFHEAAAAGSSPTIRRMAQALGIDLAQVRASGPGGRITSEDLKAYVASLKATAASTPPAPSAPAAAAQTAPIDYAKWGPVRIEPLSALRQTVSRRMTEAWTTIPHVTQHEWTDVTRLLARRKVLAEDYRKRGAHLTVTAVLVPILVEVLKKYPVFNSSLDSIGARMIFKDYYHVGIAVDTPAGLMVPVIKNADKLSLEQICVQIE
ncbi:MAG: 2-oxo acid dehydrogenase subunit E2, partial [Candidatus Omnitrophota bacterium]